MPGAIKLQSHTKAQWPQRFLYNRHPPPCPSWLRVRNNLFLLMLLVGQALTRSTGRGKRLLAQPSPISCPAAGRADARLSREGRKKPLRLPASAPLRLCVKISPFPGTAGLAVRTVVECGSLRSLPKAAASRRTPKAHKKRHPLPGAFSFVMHESAYSSSPNMLTLNLR
jgi:hypothetical protein